MATASTSIPMTEESRVNASQRPQLLKQVKNKAGCTCPTSSKNKNLPAYQYSTLNGKQTIRLLRLLPTSTLAFELFPVNIHKAPPYLALSYTWGSPTSYDAITIDGQSIAILKNLADAIKSIRHYLTENHLMLWADFVCINQDDVWERSHQVQLMHSIYRCAECVGIWLGRSTNDSDLVMDMMTEWKCEYDRFCESFEDNWERAVTSMSGSNTTFYGSTQHEAWQAFQTLIQRAWGGKSLDRSGSHGPWAIANTIVLWRSDGQLVYTAFRVTYQSSRCAC